MEESPQSMKGPERRQKPEYLGPSGDTGGARQIHQRRWRPWEDCGPELEDESAAAVATCLLDEPEVEHGLGSSKKGAE